MARFTTPNKGVYWGFGWAVSNCWVNMLINANLDAISAEDVVVLANNRQVLGFKKTWAIQKGNTQLPKALSWQQYLVETWQNLNPNSSKRLLSVAESRALIANSLTAAGQTPNNRLLDEVIKNINYCYAHLIHPKQLLNTAVAAHEYFSIWLQHYQANKYKLNLIDTNDLPQLILKQLDSAPQPITVQPTIYGFKTLTPAQSKLLSRIGCQTLNAKQPNQASHNKIFNTTDDEIRHVANWAKDLHTSQPNKTIAIVSPQLSREHYQIKSIFDEVFNDILNETGQKAYNISLGLPLTHYPLIQHILLMLQLSQQLQNNHISTEIFNAVITSPYINHAQVEQSSRALLVNRVLSWSKTHFKLAQLKQHLANTPLLESLIDATLTLPKQTRCGLDQWLVNFDTHLQTWGFAADRTLSSVEYQLFNKYLNSRLGLNQLAQTQNKVGNSAAIMHLQDWLSQIIFQAQSASTPIQILGSLEAEGLYFDAAWVLGMTDDFLPASLNTPRFIPSNIAIAHQIPHSSFALIAEDAKNTRNNLINLSDEVTCSYANIHHQSEQHGSALLDFNHTETLPVKATQGADLTLKSIQDAQANTLENTQIKNGVNTLKDQMACAFKGFAHRLNIQQFDAPRLGLSRADQGKLVHQVLEQLYQQLPSQTALLDCQPNQLDAHIQHNIEQALSHYPSSGFTQVERNRLTQLVNKLIILEKQRDNFSVIATEQKIEVNVNGLAFTTRLDRIDALENGEHIIFDYKTGNLPSNPWCGKAIKEPQLPIYATNDKINAIDGVAFIQVASDKISYSGLANNHDSLPNKTAKQQSCTEWLEQRKLWQQQLNQASTDYQSGKAEVLPNTNACVYCEYDSLCRIEK